MADKWDKYLTTSTVEADPWEKYVVKETPQPLPGSTPRLRAAAGAPETEPLFGSTARLRTATGAPDIPEDPRARFGKFITDKVAPAFGETMKGAALGMMPRDWKDAGEAAISPGTYAARRTVVEPAIEMGRRAIAAPTVSEKIGYGAAAALPMVGPAAVDIGEEVGRGELGRVAGKVGAMATLGALGKTATSRLGAYEVGRPGRAAGKAAMKLQDAHENVGKPLLTNLTKRGVSDVKFSRDVFERNAIGDTLDELGNGAGVEAGKAALKAAVPRERFEVLAGAANRRAQRIIGPVNQQIELHGQRPIRLGDAAGEIRGSLTEQFRRDFPSEVARLEKIADNYDAQGVTTLGEAYRDVVNLNQLLDTLAKKPNGEFARITNSDPTWGYLVRVKENLRDQVFKKSGMPDWVLEEYQRYGSQRHLADSLAASQGKYEGWVPSEVTGAPGWKRRLSGGAISAVGTAQGRLGTAAYGASRALLPDLAALSPFELLTKAVDALKVSPPRPLQGPTAARALLAAPPETAGQEFRPGPQKLLGPGEPPPNYPPPSGELPLGHRRPGGDLGRIGAIPESSELLTPGQRLAEQVRAQRLGRTARPELGISERLVQSPAEIDAARQAQITAARNRFLREHGARPMTNLGRNPDHPLGRR